MKKISLFIIVPMLLVFSTSAYSAEGLYVSGNAGYAMLSDGDYTEPGEDAFELEFDPGFTLGAALGYGFGKTRIEGEISYQKNDLNKASGPGWSEDLSGDITALAFLVNGYYDFTNKSRFTPYISGGVGLAKIEINDEDESLDDTVFAYQIGAGVGYAVSEKVTIDIKYRYFATSDPKFEEVGGEFASHNFLLGVRVNF